METKLLGGMGISVILPAENVNALLINHLFSDQFVEVTQHLKYLFASSCGHL